MIAAFVGAGAAQAQQRSHVHGAATLEVVSEGQKLVVRLQAPLEALVGFEHAPRTPAQRQAIAGLEQTLRDGGQLFAPGAAAACTPVASNVLADGSRGQGGHADVEVEFVFRCTSPAQLRTVDLRLFERFPRLRKIDAVMVSEAGQAQRTLKRPQRQLVLPASN